MHCFDQNSSGYIGMLPDRLLYILYKLVYKAHIVYIKQYILYKAHYFLSKLVQLTFNFCNDALIAKGKKVRILSQLRELDPHVCDASRMLPLSSGLLEVLPIYQLFVDYIVSNGFAQCMAIAVHTPISLSDGTP
jgi:hypothetical protein